MSPTPPLTISCPDHVCHGQEVAYPEPVLNHQTWSSRARPQGTRRHVGARGLARGTQRHTVSHTPPERVHARARVVVNYSHASNTTSKGVNLRQRRRCTASRSRARGDRGWLLAPRPVRLISLAGVNLGYILAAPSTVCTLCKSTPPTHPTLSTSAHSHITSSDQTF